MSGFGCRRVPKRMLAGFAAVGARTLLVSGGFTFFTDRLKDRLGLDETVSNTLEIVDGKLTGRVSGAVVDAQVKASRFIALRKSSVPATRSRSRSAMAPTICRC
jgi:phosphoserine phosphatase